MSNTAAQKAAARKYRESHQEEIQIRTNSYNQSEKGKAYKRAWHVLHREELRARKRDWYYAHRNQELTKDKTRHLANRTDALQQLGRICACPGCGVSDIEFLTVDHINGRATRKNKRSAAIEAKASGWDKTRFQILCANCNLAKHDKGFCPVHQSRPEQNNNSGQTALSGIQAYFHLQE